VVGWGQNGANGSDLLIHGLRTAIGIERLPAFDLGLPSMSFPPTCAMDRRTRIRRAFRSMSSTLSGRPTA
jgi:hypothetical protein